MATVRKGGPLKKGPDSNQGSPASGRRTPAWSNRASPSPGPAFNANSRGQANGFPPLASQANGKATPNAWGSPEDKQQLLANLAGSINQTITVTLRGNTRHEGVLTFVSPSATDDASLTLKNAKDLSAPNASPKDNFLKIPASNVLSFSPGSSGTGTMSKVHDSFRTDAEISRTGSAKRERELQAWQPDPSDAPSNSAGNGIDNPHVDDVTFGPGASSGGQWDQFAVNERLFGVRTNFDEEEYTTRLDRNAKDYKERERRAEQIAAEITGGTTSNPHVAEERGLAVDDSGVNEEDKYGAVVRGANAYIPPGARRQATGSDVATPSPAKGPDKENKENQGKPEAPVPKVSINAPDGSDKPPARTTANTPGNPAAKQPADAVPAFRDFVTNEKQRLTQKKQALVKNEMEKRVAELVKFSQTFKLNKPIPDDLVPILAKDEEKQRLIREKSTQDAQSTKARAIGVSASVLTASGQQKAAGASSTAKSPEPSRKASAHNASSLGKPTDRVPSSKSSNALQANATATTSAPAKPNGNGKIESSKTMPRISMVIQPIPPFRGGKKQSAGDTKASSSASSSSQPMSPTSQQRLNVNATTFRPNPKAPAFTPTGSTSPQVQAQAVSPKPRQETAASVPSGPNPFFGTQVIKKTPPVNVKEDFNPFKSGKVQDAKIISPNWPYTGKRYTHVLPSPPTVAAPPPQASPHVAPHGPPPPPPSYDEDAAAQAQAAAATRGYAVYAYAPYYPGQPPQPMMAGMAGVPPGAFIPTPYMQPMPYPPNMHPPNGQPMYAPPHMAQMPPPQQYMQPQPPPGAYPPPPGSAGPRPSMPPTPIPAHAHPYYHQSPQLQHAMPYPMMMPPPAPNAPHPYEAGPPPPVPMGGVGHA